MFTQIAARNGVDIIIFPELSLTGYELELAQNLALHEEDELLIPLRDASNRWDITIIAGCPIKLSFSKPYIGSFIFQPDKPTEIYRKRYLFKGEEQYFIPSQDNIVFLLKGEMVGVAICADIDNPQHPSDTKGKGATIYAAGVLMTPTGIENSHKKMSEYSAKYNLLSVMSNHAIDSGGYTTAGQSAIGDNSGKILAQAGKSEKALILACKEENKWTGILIEV